MAKSRVSYHGQDLSAPKDRDFKALAAQLNLDLFQADFSYATLEGVDFSRLSLREADFSHAKIKGANFSHADLRGAKFTHSSVGVNANSSLEGVNFQNAQIQGTDFSEAFLFNADFTGAKAGLRAKWHIKLLTLIGLIGSAFTAAIVCTFFLHFFRKPSREPSQITLPSQKPSIANFLFVFLVSSLLIIGFRAVLLATGHADWIFYHVLFGIGLILLMLVYSVVISGVEAEFSSLLLIFITAMLPILVRQFTGSNVIAGIVGALIGAGLGCGFSRLAIARNEGWKWLNFDWLWSQYVSFAASKGTKFNRTDLTGANFTGAHLRGVSFLNTKLAKAKWKQAKYLDCAEVDANTYLGYAGIRHLLVTGAWKENDKFDGLDLRGIDLSGAIIRNTSFIGTDLSYADLQGTDLSYSNLKKASLDGANLEGATLTGVVLQSCSTDEKTILKNITCDFIFLKDKDAVDPNDGIQERMPDAADGNFNTKEKDFETLFAKDDAVLQLLIRDSDNRQALVAAFQQLIEDRETSYTFQGFEVKGKIALVKIRVSQGVNKNAVRSKFYQELKRYKPSVQKAENTQDVETQDLKEFLPKVLLALEELKEMVTNGSITVGTYNVFQQVTSQRFIQGDAINQENS